VLAQILGGGSTSRLYRALVVDQGVAASAGAWYQGSALDTTKLGVYATPRSEVDLGKLEKALDGELKNFLAAPISDKELDRAKTKLVAEAVYAQDNQSSMARLYGTTLTTGGKIEDIAQWPAKIRAVTADDVKRVARDVLDLRRSVTGLLVPETAETKQ
jgi:zinc protease